MGAGSSNSAGGNGVNGGHGHGHHRLSSVLQDHLLPHLQFGSHHCAMIGLDSSGKTTVLYRLKFDQYVNTAPTIGFNCEKVRTKGGGAFTVWDVGGQDKLRPLWRSYTRCTDGIIFVVDSTGRDERMEEAKLELLKFCRATNGHGGVPVLVLANKQDLPAAADASKLESCLGLRDLGPQVPWHLQPTCAVTGDGLQEGMQKLQEMITTKKRKGGGNGGKNGMRKSSSTRKLQRSHSHVY